MKYSIQKSLAVIMAATFAVSSVALAATSGDMSTAPAAVAVPNSASANSSANLQGSAPATSHGMPATGEESMANSSANSYSDSEAQSATVKKYKKKKKKAKKSKKAKKGKKTKKASHKKKKSMPKGVPIPQQPPR